MNTFKVQQIDNESTVFDLYVDIRRVYTSKQMR